MADRHNQAWILELKIQVMPAIFAPKIQAWLCRSAIDFLFMDGFEQMKA